MRSLAKRVVNGLAESVNARIVNKSWGPRGFLESFKKLKAQGVAPQQIVDAGAARGGWTEECLSVFPDANYFLVDPLEENLPSLRSVASRHGKVRPWQGALGGQAGSMEMLVHGDQSSFLSSEYSAGGKATPRSIAVRTLDSFIGSEWMPALPAIIKADVQGYELEVLRGAEACMRSADYVLLEVLFRSVYEGCPLAHDVIAFMRERDYRIYDICGYGQRPSDGELYQSDILFARRGAKVFGSEGYA